MTYEVLKWIHILSAILLFGTGLGSAYYKWCADRSGNLQVMVHTNKMVVRADWIFVAPTVVIQPLTGFLLVKTTGFSFTEFWLVVTYILYAVAGLSWLPVVWIQIRMETLSQKALVQGTELNEAYFKLARIWFWLGVPAFFSMLVILIFMVFKPGATIFG